MINLQVEYVADRPHERYLQGLRNRLEYSSPQFQAYAKDVAEIYTKDNTDKVLGHGMAGIDQFGRSLAPLGAWAYKPGAMERRGSGPVLAPHGMASRVISTFHTQWATLGRQLVFTAGWQGFLSRRGFPIMRAHIMGGWRLPVRDVGGLSPEGRRRLAERSDRLSGELLTAQE